MKAQKKLNVVLIILIIILISIISFVGIFYQNKNKMSNYIKEYNLGTDLDGYRKIILLVDEDNEENTDELKNYDNYVKSADIIRNRLDSMNITDYSVECNESTGQIEIRLPENSQTDYILADITQKGKFEVADTSTEEVLMTNADIRSANVRTTTLYSGTQAVYMDINFNGEGSKKFKDITINYQNIVTNETVANETENTTSNETTENEITNETSNETTNETSDETSEDTTEEAKQIALNIDGTSMMTTTFSEVIDNGVLSLSLGTASSDDDLRILTYQAESLAAILENDEMPLQYEVTGNMYVSSPIEQNQINIFIYIGIAIVLIMFMVLIVKYKTKGLAYALSMVGFIAVYLLIIRYANVTLTLEGILAISLVFVIDYIFGIMLLNRVNSNVEKSFKKALSKFSISLIPMLILSVACCFSGWMPIFSFGMITFWGLIISVIYNFIITQLFIKNLSK